MSVVEVVSEKSIVVSSTDIQVVEVKSKGEKGDPGADGEGVPVGGADGQVLAKASATDYDTEWINQSGGTPVFANSNRYLNYYSGFWYRTGYGDTIRISYGGGVLRGGFISFDKDVSIDALGIEVTATSTANYHLGIYEISETDPTVGTLKLDSGEQSLVATAGPQTVPVTFTFLRDKLYALTVLSDATITLRCINQSAGYSVGQISPAETVSAGELFGGNKAYGPLTNYTVTSGLTFRPPFVYFRKA